MNYAKLKPWDYKFHWERPCEADGDDQDTAKGGCDCRLRRALGWTTGRIR